MNQDPHANEVRPGETQADVLRRQMQELGTTNYWEAVHLTAERAAANERERSFWGGVFGL